MLHTTEALWLAPVVIAPAGVIVHLARRLTAVTRRNRALLDTMADGFCVYAAVRDDAGEVLDFRCDFANDAAGAVAGMAPEQQVGRWLSELFPSALGDGMHERYRELVTTGEPLAAEQQIGEQVFDVRAVPLADGFAVALRDVTDRRRADERVARAQAELERSNAALGEFAHVVSHELSEPLATAALYAETLEGRSGPELDAPAHRLLEMLLRTLGRMQERIDGLLDYAKVREPCERDRPVDCVALVRHVLAELESSIVATGARVSVAPLPTVAGDEDQLALVFENLLSNAIRFRREGERPAIAVSGESGDGGWHFAVADRGPGIAPHDTERIFGLFERASGGGRPGTGIGLAVCRKVVEEHGGRIWVESRMGAGSTFHFTLAFPAAVSDAPPAPSLPAA